MKKLKVTIAFAALALIMNSCVYSLFPIYTKDTLVYLPELVGKWQAAETDGDSYIEFIPMNDEKKLGTMYAPEVKTEFEMNEDTDGDKSTYSYFMKGDGWSIKSDSPITVEIDGETISDTAQISAYYDGLFGEMKSDLEEGVGAKLKELDSLGRSDRNSLGDGLKKLGKGLKDLSDAMNDVSAKFSGSTYVSQEESYKMTVKDNGEELSYQANVVEIGEDYFLDLFPFTQDEENTFGNNLFPVHTFMKVNIEEGQLVLTQFDLEKLNELFESNLVRLRHEYVDGNVVITAQPEEIQKFLDKYSNDETVFESEETYTKTIL